MPPVRELENCIAKSAISAVVLTQAKLVGATPALAWNSNTHPKHGTDMFGKPRVLNGHAYLLASDTMPPHKISGISYNPDSIINSNWEIFDFNDDGQFSEVNEDNEIVATEAGKTVGYVIDNWHDSARQYMEALGENESIYHQTTIDDLSALIVDTLVDKDLLSRFTQ